MRELRSCDFCGGDAAGTFEVVPPELEPTEAEQRRVVLCPDCKARLETLVEPLLARAGAGTGEATATESSGDSTGETTAMESTSDDGDDTSATESGTVVASADESTRKRARESSPNATVSDAGDGDESESKAEAKTEPDAESGPESSDGEDGSSDESSGSSKLEEGITFERSADADDEASSEPSATTAEPAASETGTRPPRAYNKVVRLLRNRQFPMPRSAVEELAAGAYDLEPEEVDAVVDYAIEQGEFVEKHGNLERP